MKHYSSNPEFLTGTTEKISMLTMSEQTTDTLWCRALRDGLSETGFLLVVSTDQQRMALLSRGEIKKTYNISTSKFGLGNILDSYKTPLGMHKIVERYGEGEPAGAEFFEREPTGTIIPDTHWSASSGKDLILTRILRLGGLEAGINRDGDVDTYERYVYLHGSDNEHALGQTPTSHGCIHVANREIIDLYDAIKDTPTWVWIGKDISLS